MATRKLTITLEEGQLEAIKRLVGSGRARTVSGFVKHAVDVALQDIDGWAAMLGEALEQTGGRLTAREKAWAGRILEGPRKSTKRKRRSAA